MLGDTTGQLLWRIMHGEIPAKEREPKAAFILIGANDVITARAVVDGHQAPPVRVRPAVPAELAILGMAPHALLSSPRSNIC